ncbi:MAG: alcohol dehydrogenase catalytic domain-containing protein, partial [Pseudomonadota bacterium]
MKIIKAAICHEFGQSLRIEDVQLRGPGPDEIEVELHAVAICHSDISYLSGHWGGVLPAVYGHEAAGVVAEVGRSVKGLQAGDPVVVTLLRACGDCEHCSAGRPYTCGEPSSAEQSPLRTLDSQPLEQGMHCGAFAERAVVHHSQVARVSPELPMAQASLLACGVITGIG